MQTVERRVDLFEATVGIFAVHLRPVAQTYRHRQIRVRADASFVEIIRRQHRFFAVRVSDGQVDFLVRPVRAQPLHRRIPIRHLPPLPRVFRRPRHIGGARLEFFIRQFRRRLAVGHHRMRSQQEAAVNNHHMKRQRQHAQQVVRVQPASEFFACAESEKLRQNLFMHNHAADYRRQRDHRGRSRQPVTAVFRRREVAVDGNQITRPRRFARFGLRRVRIRADGGIGRLFGPTLRPAQI